MLFDFLSMSRTVSKSSLIHYNKKQSILEIIASAFDCLSVAYSKVLVFAPGVTSLTDMAQKKFSIIFSYIITILTISNFEREYRRQGKSPFQNCSGLILHKGPSRYCFPLVLARHNTIYRCPFKKLPIKFNIFQMELPDVKSNWPCPLKDLIPGMTIQ